MKKTLVLVVDRDDDFGVKGKVNTPVIGVQNCLDAATAFGIADPEDSDLNALYAAVSVCLEIQEDGHEADVALICGDEKVGHRSDLALVSQLEEVLEEIEPDSVVLVGDGAEDEYIYPIISSRAHVDSVKKMMSDVDKRKRFLVPLGFVLLLLSLFYLIPGLLVYLADRSPYQLSALSGPLAVFIIGLIVLAYGYDITERMYNLRTVIMASLIGRTTSIIFLCVSAAFLVIMAAYAAMEIGNLYLKSDALKVVYFVSTMIWPLIIAVIIYMTGMMIEKFIRQKSVSVSVVFGLIGLASLGLVALGILDVAMLYMGLENGSNYGILEIIAGVALSIFSNFFKSRMPLAKEGTSPDEVY